MRLKLIYGTAIAAIVLYSCTKVISVDLNAASPKIVIEGNIYNIPGPYRIELSKTVAFSDANVFPPVRNAVVTIVDQTANLTDLLSETSAGVYTTHTIQGIPGHTYLMTVLAEGQTYTASCTMPQPVTLDSVTFRQQIGRGGDNTIFALSNFQDPAGAENQYVFDMYINGTRYKKGSFIFSDRLSDGRYISNRLVTDSVYIKYADTVRINMFSVDKPVYNYFLTLANVTNSNGFQSASPADPVSNISKGALGYFSARTVNSKTAVVK